MPIEQHIENGEQLKQAGLEEAEAASERALVPLRQFCQYLGVHWASQYQRTKRDEILAREMMSVVLLTMLIRAAMRRVSL